MIHDVEYSRDPLPLGCGTVVEHETRRRVHLAIAAYAYEVRGEPVMSDRCFDMLAQQIRPRIGTCHPLLDEFFMTEFSPMTGMWIHKHPQLDRVEKSYDRFAENMRAFYAKY